MLTACELRNRYEALLARIARRVVDGDDLPLGGALLGPRLFLMAAIDAVPDDRLLRLGTVIELLRRATLVHRDPTLETTWNVEDAPFSQTLRGDSLLARAFRLLAADGDPRTAEILSRAMASVAEGEMDRGQNGNTVRAARRLAAFYAGAAATGALVAGLSQEQTAACAAYATYVGEVHAARRWGIGPAPELVAAPPGMESLAAMALQCAGLPDIMEDVPRPPAQRAAA